MIGSDEEELAMAERFSTVAERWALSGEEVAWLLSSMDDNAAHGLVCIGSGSETAMRLMIELDGLLLDWMRVDELVAWLRREPAEGPDPLTFISLGLTHLRALVQAARLRAREAEVRHISGARG